MSGAFYAAIVGLFVIVAIGVAAMISNEENEPAQAQTQTQVGNVTQSIVMPQTAAENRTVPQTAAEMRGGYTTDEYAEMLGVSVREIQDRCKRGEIECVKADNGHYLIGVDE